MAWYEPERRQRRFDAVGQDQRPPFARDRDRVLYSSALRRLAGVAQVVRVGESDVFHTRLTHSLKVAQIGRRLAERRQEVQGGLCAQLGVSPEVVEAACLAHDLGHPPFGHVGEEALNRLVLKAEDADGFEGNAQAFRIVTKLPVRFEECPGLDLTRATLAAILKYPWMRLEGDADKSKKWGAYSTEGEDFDFARDGLDGEARSAEAELMDWADDIAYSVHDLEDFHRCRVIPWHRVFEEDRGALLAGAEERWKDPPADGTARLEAALESLRDLMTTFVPKMIREPYDGSRSQRREIRFLTSKLIGRYIDAITLKHPDSIGAPCVEIRRDPHAEVQVLKQITRHYAIQNPALAAQQRGHRRVVKEPPRGGCSPHLVRA